MSSTNLQQQQLTRLQKFRQSIYVCFLRRADALMNLLDAVLDSGRVESLAELSLSGRFERQWHSTYAALEDGLIAEQQIHLRCLEGVPSTGRQYFALDVSAYVRRWSPTLQDRQYVHIATGVVGSQGISIGYRYSMLAWSESAGGSWSLPVHTKRIKSDTTPTDVAVEQLKWLAEHHAEQMQCCVVLDGAYGSRKFYHEIVDLKLDILTRLRRDRVLYQEPPDQIEGARKTTRKYGDRFAFKDPQTWPPPSQEVVIETKSHGQVRLQLWENLLLRDGSPIRLDVLRSQIQCQRPDPPKARFYGWHRGSREQAPTAEEIYRSTTWRWPIEPAFRFRKQSLNWQGPHLRQPEACDRWTTLLSLVQWHLYFSREVLEQIRRPWQPQQSSLTPERALQSFGGLFRTIGTPARPVQPRGLDAPGWTPGRQRARPTRYTVVYKNTKRPKINSS